MSKRKPREIKVGNAYRLYRPFSLTPSDQLVVVTAIRQATKTSRQVEVEWLHPGPPYSTFNYSEFMRRVHSEARVN